MASNKGDIGASRGPISVAAKLREQVALDATVQNDPKYKKYAQQVEKCLASFETMNEWPDFISFLKQLLKTLQSYTQFKEIPRKLIVSKRLAQCLIPALPSGVHQRALDVYSHILSVLGPDGLKRDLPLWSSGLFPFFEYAATNVRPVVLGILEKYYIPLQEELRPIMRAFIIALLPGLEEETSEIFERVIGLLDRLSGTVSPSFFLQNIWLVMLTTQVSRAYCLNYLSRRLPKLDATEDITPIVGRDIGLMVRAFAAALGDDNLLVQRGALDLLLTSLRLEGHALRVASPKDRELLTRAATGVVLRRDLSLNRRLFAWLLGPEENIEKQSEYFITHARTLLLETLRDEMLHPSSEYSATRPFKIYVSLLDKWEIGAPLTEVLIFDSLRAIKQSLDSAADGREEFLITANTLFEAVEPKAIWKQLFKALREEICTSSSNNECVNLILFVLRTFRIDDDEVQNIHLPLLFCALVERLEDLSKKEPQRLSSPMFSVAMKLLEAISERISMNAMTVPLQIPNFAFGGSFDDAACAFYEITADQVTQSTDKQEESLSTTEGIATTNSKAHFLSAIPFVASFECISELAATSVEMQYNDNDLEGRDILESVNKGFVLLETFVQCVSLILRLITALDKVSVNPGTSPLKISWDARSWFNCICRPLRNNKCSFLGVDKVISLAICLHKTTSLQPTLSIDSRQRLMAMIKAVLCYLRPNTSSYHVRAVQLIWELQNITSNRHIESILAQTLISDMSSTDYEAFGAFGILWRLSDDNQQPGIHFKVPMLTILDTLKSTSPILQRVGETWLRCNLKSYPRVLDSILLELLDPEIRFSEIKNSVLGHEVQGFIYEKPFDHHRIAYLLDILLHLVRFGGLNFNRVTSATIADHSPTPEFVERLGHLGYSGKSYMSVLIDILLRYLQTEPRSSHMFSMQRMNVEIQSTSIDLLQCVSSRSELESSTLIPLESAVIEKLYMLVHSSQLPLQNKLLHLLHSVVSSTASLTDGHHTNIPNSIAGTFESNTDKARLPIDSDSSNSTPLVLHPLLVRLLVDGITTPSNRPLLHHWLDFILMTVPQFPQVLNSAISPLNICICRQIRHTLDELEFIMHSASGNDKTVFSSVDDGETIMLLNALERLILISLDDVETTPTDIVNSSDKPASDGTGILSMVSNVFLTDTLNQTNETPMTARSPGYRSLHEGIGVLYSTWSLVSKPLSISHPSHETLSLIFSRTSNRCRRVLERLYRAYAFEVIESVIEYWSIDQASSEPGQVAFDIVDFLTASAQNVVHMVCESISWRVSPAGERSRKQVLNPDLTDVILFTFLEEYLAKLENPLALQVWTRYLTLAKDVTANVKEFRSQVFPVLRCTTVLASKIAQTTAIEDRRMRKDIQDTYSKLLDACILLSGKSLDQGIWPRRTKDALSTATNGSLSRSQSEVNLEEKLAGSPGSAAESTQKSPVVDLTDRINQYLANSVLPNLRRFLVENDKIISACNNIVYYVLSPVYKSRSNRIAEIEDVFIRIMEEMTKIPAAVKAWRGPVVEIFNDSKIFSATPKAGLKWRSIIKTLIDTDKSVFGELLGKLVSTTSANIFVNREYEMQMKAQNIRRLSFVLFSSEKNHFLTQLPVIQEKLVDLLRNSNSPLVESEIYLCIRILLCRLSPHNLSSFWPVLLSELIRIFEQIMAEPPSDGSDSLLPVLSACKLIDLLLVLQTEEFQIHQWIFITDTVDAIYRPDNWFPDAVMDQLSETVGELPASETRKSGVALPDATTPSGSRQPLLKSAKSIDSIHDLAPFFSHLSIMSYEGVYASGGVVDWEAVEQSLLEDIFDGR